MSKTVNAFEARRQFGSILKDVSKGSEYVVNQHGEPVAAVIPIHRYQALQRGRQEFLDTMRAASRRANLSPEEADAVAAEAVQAVRRQEREERAERGE